MVQTHKKIAVISMYTPGMVGPGLLALEDLARRFGDYTGTFTIRAGDPIPQLDDFDVLLSSGGPGDPTELEQWGRPYADLIDAIHSHNIQPPTQPKRAFLICHSFQVMSHIWGLGAISKRPQALWGVHQQIHQQIPSDVVPVFPMDDFYALESRFYQVQPTHDLPQKCAELDLVIVAKDDIGALTAWQTRDGHIAATQFHPEGRLKDVEGLIANPPSGEDYCINMCPPNMIPDTQQRLHLMPIMEQMLVDFITKI